MNNDQLSWLFNCRRLPGRLIAEQAVRLLGFAPHDLPVLVAAKLLTPLGKPSANCARYFAAVDIEAYAKDRVWLDKATKTVREYWQHKNRVRTRKNLPPSPTQADG